jgi:acyl carrier protein
MSLEDYLHISIPDLEAEKIVTIQDMVDTAAAYKGIAEKSSVLQARLAQRVNTTLTELQLTSEPLAPTDRVFAVLNPFQGPDWLQFCEILNLVVPKPEIKDPPKAGLFKALRGIIWRVSYDWQAITLDQFLTVIAAANCEKLIDREAIRDHFELYCVILAVVVEKTGVDFYEVGREKSFANDLGID